MAKETNDKQTVDAFPVNTYAINFKYVHSNGLIRNGTAAVQASNVEEATTKAHALIKEFHDKYKLVSVKLW